MTSPLSLSWNHTKMTQIIKLFPLDLRVGRLLQAPCLWNLQGGCVRRSYSQVLMRGAVNYTGALMVVNTLICCDHVISVLSVSFYSLLH